ncbi:MAG TPA: hypothetical protein VFW31_17330 [Candidatus Angelobacter sp.]|nr:hypothetical protein [Candidatus Angelobacter sp.]
MAVSQAKRSRHSAQSRAPQTASATTPKPSKRPQQRKKPRRRRYVSLLPPPVITRRGKTTIRRFSGRSVHHMEEVKGKIVDSVEFYTSSESHAIDVRFQDKTTLHFSIDPGFLLETEYVDWKTGDYRRIKRWPTLRSLTSSSA